MFAKCSVGSVSSCLMAMFILFIFRYFLLFFFSGKMLSKNNEFFQIIFMFLMLTWNSAPGNWAFKCFEEFEKRFLKTVTLMFSWINCSVSYRKFFQLCYFPIRV